MICYLIGAFGWFLFGAVASALFTARCFKLALKKLQAEGTISVRRPEK